MKISEYQIFSFDSIDSTQKELQRRFNCDQINHADVIIASHQSDSIGRNGRKWHSVSGNSSLTIAVNIEFIEQIAEITFISAVACGNAILSLSPHTPIKYKWVNDIMINESKVGGILCQYYPPYMLIGIGINIESSPSLDDRKTTCLKQHGYQHTSAELNQSILDKFKLEYNIWLQYGVESALERWAKMSHVHGEDISIKIGDAIHKGNYLGINQSGAIIIKDSFGEIRTINCGEVL